MKRWIKNTLRFSAVTLGIIILTSFSIDATSTLQGSNSALSIFANKVTKGGCPSDMSSVNIGSEVFCMDSFEVSPGPDCPVKMPTSVIDTAQNSGDSRCLPVSEKDKSPWTYVAKPQAAQLCAKAGKRLPSASEWYQAALGTPDGLDTCNSAGKLASTGAWKSCVSGSGVNDMVGNVWEYIDGEVVDGQYSGRALPAEGYIEQVDSDGIALETAEVPNIIYNDDYFWTRHDGRSVLMRGGFYGSKSDGGIYTTHAQVDHNFASAATGFRCVKSLP